jgi:Zn-dependent protease with chaperone function
MKHLRKLEDRLFVALLVALGASLVLIGILGANDVIRTPTNASFDGSQLVAPNESPTDLLLGHAVPLNPNLAVDVSLILQPASNFSANGIANIDLERYGFAVNPGFARKTISFGIPAGSYLNESLEFYTIEQNNFQLLFWLSEGSDPVNVSWHVQVDTMDFTLSTFSPLLIIVGSVFIVELFRLRPILLSYRPYRIIEHSAVILAVLFAILLFPAHDLSQLMHYFLVMGFSQGSTQLATFNAIQLMAALLILIFPVILYLLTSRILKRKYHFAKFVGNYKIAHLVSEVFGSVRLYSFSSDDPNACLIGPGRPGPEIGISTALMKGFESGDFTKNDIINIVGHEFAHIVNLDIVFWNFGRILRQYYKYWAIMYVAAFWLTQLLRINGGVAPIVYMRLADLIAGFQFLLTGHFAEAKYILPFLDVNVIGEFLTVLAFSLIVPYFVLFVTLRESEFAADREACVSFTTRDLMSETLRKILRTKLKKLGILSFSPDLTPSERIRKLKRPVLSTDFCAPVRNGVAIGILSYAMFTLFDAPFGTLFLLPIIGISMLQILRSYSAFDEARPLKSLRKIGAAFKKIGLESVVTGVAYLVIALVITASTQELRNLGGLEAAAATGLVYIPIAAFFFSSFLILDFIRA